MSLFLYITVIFGVMCIYAGLHQDKNKSSNKVLILIGSFILGAALGLITLN